MLNECILILAVSLDIFIVALSCGLDCIKIPILSAVSVGLVGMITMAISLYCSNMVEQYVSNRICSGIGCAVLCAMGGANIIKWIIERRQNDLTKKSLLDGSTDSSILDIYIYGSRADCDHSKEISIREAIIVALLMSFDTLVCGIVGGSNLNIWFVSIGIFIFQTIIVIVGSWIGRKCTNVPNVSFIGGILLILLGITKVI